MSPTEFITGLVLGVIQKARGKSDDFTAKKVAAAVADKVKEDLSLMIAGELQKFAGALGIVLATHELANATLEVLQAMHEAEAAGGKSFGALPAEQMPADWKPEPEQ